MRVAQHAGESGGACWWEWWSMLVRVVEHAVGVVEHAGESGGACW